MRKKLDDELADAIRASGTEDAPGVVKAVAKAVPARAPARAPNRKRSIGLLLTLIAMTGAVVALFLGVFQPAAVYATPVDKLVHQRQAFVARKVRVEGELVPGTLVKRDKPCEYRFSIHKDDAVLPVTYAQCVIPDGFRDVPQGGVQVTIEGALPASGDFQASLVMAKCSSKYDPAKHEMEGKQANGALPVN
jgi:cytochrome c-type biogenesis protein CcmE